MTPLDCPSFHIDGCRTVNLDPQRLDAPSIQLWSCPHRRAHSGDPCLVRCRAQCLRRRLGLIRSCGQVNYVASSGVRSSSFWEKSTGCGRGGKPRSWRFSTASTPSSCARRSKAAGLIWPSVECRRRWLIEHFDVIDATRSSRRGNCRTDPRARSSRWKDTLHHGVVVTIAAAAHAARDAVCIEAQLVVFARVR